MIFLKNTNILLLTTLMATLTHAAPAHDDAENPPHYLALVVGAARSGTSTVTAAVNACGYSLTPAAQDQKDQLAEAQASEAGPLNPKGTLEDGLFLKIGREFLTRTKGAHPLPPSHPLMQKGRKNIGIFFNTIFRDTAHVVLKHPALSQYAHILETRAQQEDVGAQRLNIQFKYVFALRHPADVGLSMVRAFSVRNPELTVQQGMEQWAENLSAALTTSEGKSRYFIKYEDLMNPDMVDEALGKMSGFLGTTLTPEALGNFKTQFLLPDQQHNKTPFTGDHPDHPMTDAQRALRDTLETIYQAQNALL